MKRNTFTKTTIITIIIIKTFNVVAKPQDIYYSKLDKEGYSFSYETPDGQKRNESATIDDNNTISVSGSYGYATPDGAKVEVTYVADEFGYRPVVKVRFAIIKPKPKNYIKDFFKNLGVVSRFPISSIVAQSLQGGGAIGG